MKKLLSNSRARAAAWLLLGVLCLLLLTIKAPHLSLHKLIPDASLRQQTIAALIGSVFGALLGSLATTFGILFTDHKREIRNRDHERQVKHYNSIVKLQRQFNVIRASLEDNTSALKSIIEANDLGLPTLQRPIQIGVDESHFENLYDIKLINMLNDAYYTIRRINLDSINLSRAQDVLADELFAGKISRELYKSEVGHFNENVKKLRQHILYTIDHSILDISAYVRICADSDASQEMKDRQARMLQDRQKITDAQIKKTRSKIIAELEQSELEGLAQQEEEANYD